MAVLLVADPQARAAPPIAALCALYGLTAAEARLAAALAAGQGLRDYATGSGIALCTARWQLQQVLAKTDTHRQSDLVRLILAGPVGLLRADGVP
jgi:DNA-binding CsgD family transcriptional regulator